jgi:hypothetical protein
MASVSVGCLFAIIGCINKRTVFFSKYFPYIPVVGRPARETHLLFVAKMGKNKILKH